MGRFRLYLTRHRIWAMWLVSAALLMKVVVPAGFMPVVAGGAIAIEPCSGFGPERMAMPGMPHHHDTTGHDNKDDMPCGFAGHAPASAASADPILLLFAIALIVATTFRMPVSWPVRRVGFLRPPLRGPPVLP